MGFRAPAMRQQFLDAGRRLGGQTVQNVLQVHIRIMAIEFGRLDQAHQSSRTLAGAETSREQPVAATEGDGANPVLQPVRKC